MKVRAVYVKRFIVVFFAMSLFSNYSAILANGAKQDTYKVEVKNGWLYVNGEKFFVKGIVYEGWRPNQSPEHLDRVDSELLENDFRMIKEAGFNTIRTAGGLTPDMIAAAKRHGLMVIHGIWFEKDIDYQDPDKIRYAQDMVQENAKWAKGFDNIITYLLMNEPSVERVKDAGGAGIENFLKRIK